MRRILFGLLFLTALGIPISAATTQPAQAAPLPIARPETSEALATKAYYVVRYYRPRRYYARRYWRPRYRYVRRYFRPRYVVRRYWRPRYYYYRRW